MQNCEGTQILLLQNLGFQIVLIDERSLWTQYLSESNNTLQDCQKCCSPTLSTLLGVVQITLLGPFHNQ